MHHSREAVMGGRDVQQQALLPWFLEVLPSKQCAKATGTLQRKQ